MLNEITRPIAQRLLQARVDGHLKNGEAVLTVIREHQPADGLAVQDFAALSEFVTELAPCEIIPGAKAVATKYGLNIAY